MATFITTLLLALVLVAAMAVTYGVYITITRRK